MSIVAQCPCGKRFAAKPELAGKQVNCPFCGQAFVVPSQRAGQKPASPAMHDPLGPATLPGYSTPSPQMPPPMPQGPAPAYAQTPQQAAGGVDRQKLIKIGAIVAVLAVVVVAGLFLVRWLMTMSGGGAGNILAYLPEDAQIVTHIRVADTLASPSYQQSAQQLGVAAQTSRFKSAVGLEPSDIESVTTGMKSPFSINMSRGIDISMAERNNVVSVTRTKVPYDKAQLLARAGNPAEVALDGATYYRGPGGIALAFPDEKTILLGTEEAVKKVLAAGPNSRPKADFSMIDPQDHVTYAMSGDTIGATDSDAMRGSMLWGMAGGIEGFSQSVRFDNEVLSRTTYLCDSSSTASEIKNAYDQALGQFGSMFSGSGGGLFGGQFGRAQGEMQKMMESLKMEVSVSGRRLIITQKGDMAGFAAAGLPMAAFGNLFPTLPSNPIPTNNRSATTPQPPAGSGPAGNSAEKPTVDLQKQMLDALVAGLKSGDDAQMKSAASRLKIVKVDENRRQEVAAALEPVLKMSDDYAPTNAAEALARWGGQENVRALLGLLSSDNTRLRWACIHALASIGGDDAVIALAERLTHVQDRNRATEALKKVKGIETRGELAIAALLRHDDLAVRKAACDVLSNVGTSRCLTFLRALEDDPSIQREVKRAITLIEARSR